MAKIKLIVELDVPETYINKLSLLNPVDLLNDAYDNHSNVSIWDVQYENNKTHYYVIKNGRCVSDYDDRERALKHAIDIGGELGYEFIK